VERKIAGVSGSRRFKAQRAGELTGLDEPIGKSGNDLSNRGCRQVVQELLSDRHAVRDFPPSPPVLHHERDPRRRHKQGFACVLYSGLCASSHLPVVPT
jgi:hypothetical protein